MINNEKIVIPNTVYEKNATIYKDDECTPKAVILYFHGGGLVYGNREDLPEYHINKLCSEGYVILAMDYILMPFANIAEIMDDLKQSVNWFLENRESLFSSKLPYFLWGRSAGAYLCLLSLKQKYSEPPAGIISYYGYGLLKKDWYNTPSSYYNAYPSVSENCMSLLTSEPCASRRLDRFFPVYVYLRQSGKWGSLFANENDANLWAIGSLEDFTPSRGTCPIFFAHSKNDTDVPFSELSALVHKFENASRYVVSVEMHDFDRDVNSIYTKELLAETIGFLSRTLEEL